MTLVTPVTTTIDRMLRTLTSRVRFGRRIALLLVAAVTAVALPVPAIQAQVSNCPFAVSANGNKLGNALLLTRYARAVNGEPLVAATGIPLADISSINSTVSGSLSRLDLDGDGVVGGYDGLVAARVLLGLGTASAVADAVPSTLGTRTSATAVKAFLDAGCPASAGAAPIVSYDFGAGDPFVNKSGWSFAGQVGPLSPIPGAGISGLQFRYPGWVVDSQSYDNGSCAWIEQGVTMPPAEQEFYLEFRLHVPANFAHRSDTGVKVAPNGGSITDWRIGDRVQGVGGTHEGVISGFGATGSTMPDGDGIEGPVVFLRNPGCANCNFAWVGTIRNLTRNQTVVTNLRRMVSANNKLMAVFADGYSGGGNGPTIVWEYWPNDATASSGQTPRRSELAVHYSRGQFSGAGSHLQGTHFIGPDDFGKFVDIMLRGKFSTSPGARDGVIETWLRRQGQGSYTRIHQILDADMDKRSTAANPGTLVPWRQAKMMGWANSCFDADTTFHISKINYYTARPAGL